MPRLAIESVTLRFVESQKMKFRTSIVTSLEYSVHEHMGTQAGRQCAVAAPCSSG